MQITEIKLRIIHKPEITKENIEHILLYKGFAGAGNTVEFRESTDKMLFDITVKKP